MRVLASISMTAQSAWSNGRNALRAVSRRRTSACVCAMKVVGACSKPSSIRQKECNV